jgi:hypothetical protein
MRGAPAGHRGSRGRCDLVERGEEDWCLLSAQPVPLAWPTAESRPQDDSEQDQPEPRDDPDAGKVTEHEHAPDDQAAQGHDGENCRDRDQQHLGSSPVRSFGRRSAVLGEQAIVEAGGDAVDLPLEPEPAARGQDLRIVDGEVPFASRTPRFPAVDHRQSTVTVRAAPGVLIRHQDILCATTQERKKAPLGGV